MKEKLIAPCGINCGVCVSYLAMKNDLNKHGFKRFIAWVVCLVAKTVFIWATSARYLEKDSFDSVMSARTFPVNASKPLINVTAQNII